MHPEALGRDGTSSVKQGQRDDDERSSGSSLVTRRLCGGVGVGVAEGKSISAGPLTNGSMSDGRTYPNGADDILSGGSISFGYNTGALVGGQDVLNGSGVAGGGTIGLPGYGGAATYSACGRIK